MTTETPIKILVVDDNDQYREALRRMLQLEDFEVCEAADLDQALGCIQTQSPDVVVTDLQMRTDREGLDLIEILKSYDPVLPVIMISAVGSFEEGALATQLGAVHVVHKSRIEEEMTTFLETIRQSYRDAAKSREWLALIAAARQDEAREENDAQVAQIKGFLGDPTVDLHVKREAYDFVTSLSESELLDESRINLQQVSKSDRDEAIRAAVQKALQQRLPVYGSLHADSRQALTTAEYLYEVQEDRELLDLARPIAFSYCFAVESEVQAKMKGKITRMGSNASNRRLVEACIDRNSRRVDMSVQQNLLRVTRGRSIHFTTANVQHLLLGMIRRGTKFRPDGLKDMGILLLCFGRRYAFSKWGQTIKMDNPLRVKGLENEAELVALAGALIALQYARNPYIHPDGLKKEQLSVVRETAFKCLDGISRVV